MKQSESKYFNTAKKMDEAFLSLLEKKDFEYITVKEICNIAGVNRSTFYLHYETINDLLIETIQNIHTNFLDYMKQDSRINGLFETKSLEELYLITPEYLKPYLSYIRDNKRLFRTVLKNTTTLRLKETYQKLFQHILNPILDRFLISESDKKYIMSFYMKGIMGIITTWLEEDCEDSLEHIIQVIQTCIPKIKEE